MIIYEKVRGNLDMTDKVVIVVGRAGGIGEASTRMYASKGAKVVVADCTENCSEVADAIAEEYGAKTIGVRCDVTDQASVVNKIKAAVEGFGEVNVLAAMPGVVFLERAADIDISVIEKHLAVNAVGVFRVCQAAANQMIKQGKGGKIVCVTSQADFIAINKHVGYTMSKAALVGMINLCAYDWAD